MGTEEEVTGWDKFVYLVKGIFLLGAYGAVGGPPPEFVETIEGDKLRAVGEDGPDEREEAVK